MASSSMIAALCILYSCMMTLSAMPQSYPQVVFDDSVGFGRQFDGFGGLSGGGATSKLLMNYPYETRKHILDYLFLPNFGANLQILKVEIGGDAQSTDGTEASHMHNSWEENYMRGYEWWLMEEAKNRNPNIKLYGLPWGFPGWVGQGTNSPYTNISVTADYIVRWIAGAKRVHSLTIDYVGIWNERSYNTDYIKLLRSMLDKQGFTSTQIIASDGHWGIAGDILKDTKLAASVYGIGCHYPGTYSSSGAVQTGKPLWSSEDYSTFNDNTGAGCWARILNQNYVNGNMTATISWNLIASYYPSLPFYRDGLMTAVEPWSGHYSVDAPIWMTAHTTQFTDIGWKYLSHKAGVGKLPQGGSYVALASPNGKDLTIVIETMSHDHSKCIRPRLPAYSVKPQNVTLNLKGSYAPIQEMKVWYSKLGFNGDSSTLFKKLTPIQFKNGLAALTLGVDEIITITSMATGVKGKYSDPPPSKPFPLPYKDSFEDYDEHEEPFNLAQQSGSFEVLQSGQNKVVRQMVLEAPVHWCNAGDRPISLIGNPQWKDIKIEIDFLLPPVNATTGVFVAARVDRGGCKTRGALGVYFFVSKDTYSVTNDLSGTSKIHEGVLKSNLTNTWHHISLSVKGNQALGWFDYHNLFNVTVPAKPANGFAAIGSNTFGHADFDNLYISSTSNERRFTKHPLDNNELHFISEYH